MRNITPEDSPECAKMGSYSQKESVSGDQITSNAMQVQLIRPDGSLRDIEVTGHFPEEHLCSLVDDELCCLETDQQLIVHLYRSNASFTQSLQSRWQDGLTDNRQVLVREVLGPSDSLRQLDNQLQDIQRRVSSGERVNLAIRSPIVARAARSKLRQLLLSDQQLDGSRLNVWVFGDEEKQQEILEHLGDAGMVRARDSSQFVQEHSERQWRIPWIWQEHRQHPPESSHPHAQHIRTPQEAVAEWIRRVEESRELSPEGEGDGEAES